MDQTIESKNIFNQILDFCSSQKLVNCKNLKVSNLTFKNNITILIEPSTELIKFEGMQINYFKSPDQILGVFEVSEYQAGKKQNELHIFSNNESLQEALKCLKKGNNRSKNEILKIYN